jgi:hypothetical protein
MRESSHPARGERKIHVIDLVMDLAIALLAGIDALPKCSYAAAGCSRPSTNNTYGKDEG